MNTEEILTMTPKNEPAATIATTPLAPIDSLPNERELPRQLELGFMFSHSLMSQTSRQVLSASAAVFALADLLVEKGMIEEDALRRRRAKAETILVEHEAQTGLGLFVNDAYKDKYSLAELPQIDCDARLPLCHAACCAMPFPLSRQDVEEGIVRWDFGRPYWNLRRSGGYCVHNDSKKHCCQVYDARPGTCRMYDCRNDKRIWLDFERRIPNPNIVDDPNTGAV